MKKNIFLAFGFLVGMTVQAAVTATVDVTVTNFSSTAMTGVGRFSDLPGLTSTVTNTAGTNGVIVFTNVAAGAYRLQLLRTTPRAPLQYDFTVPSTNGTVDAYTLWISQATLPTALVKSGFAMTNWVTTTAAAAANVATNALANVVSNTIGSLSNQLTAAINGTTNGGLTGDVLVVTNSTDTMTLHFTNGLLHAVSAP